MVPTGLADDTVDSVVHQGYYGKERERAKQKYKKGGGEEELGTWIQKRFVLELFFLTPAIRKRY
jgi:hypothetical protein